MGLRNSTLDLRLFLDILELKKQNKKESLEKTVLIIWSQILKRWLNLSIKLLNFFCVCTFLHFFSKVILPTK